MNKDHLRMAKARRVTKQGLHEFVKQAGDSHTTLGASFGTYDAVVCVDGKFHRVTTEALNPVSDAQITEITREEFDKLILKYQ